MASPICFTNIREHYCLPPPGKPDPNLPSTEAPRARVTQAPQKEYTCSFYALQILRGENKIGKKPSKEQEGARQFELLVSTHRKIKTKIDEIGIFRIKLAKELSQHLSRSCTRTCVMKFLKDGPSLDQLNLDELLYRNKKCLKVYQDFCDQKEFDNFLDFAKEHYYRAIEFNDKKFLQQFMGDQGPQNLISMKYYGKPWKNQSGYEKSYLSQVSVFFLTFENYGCRKSSWHPRQPIEKLITELERCGPLLVNGELGPEYYTDAPFLLKSSIEGRPVFGWRPSATRKERDGFYHSVVIVGAKSEDEIKHVYYVDPIDGSNPTDIKTQKIYATSYSGLQRSIANLQYTRYLSRLDGQFVYDKEIVDGENNYALYHPRTSI